jgi:hypothetical protein
MPEKSVVWVKGEAEDYAFLRECEYFCDFRGRFPVKTLRQPWSEVIAYVTLSQKSGKVGGRYLRRFWYLRKNDLKDYGTTDCPAEAVEPSSIAPGQDSVRRWDVLKRDGTAEHVKSFSFHVKC